METRLDKFVTFDLAKELVETKNKWLDLIFTNLVPRRYARMARGGAKEKAKCAAWLEAQGFIIEEHPDETRLVLNGKVISKFRITTIDGKMQAQMWKAPTIEKPHWN